jgi:hypothetical protein
MDVEAGAVAAVNTLASHSGPSAAAAAAGLLHQSGNRVGMAGPSSTLLPKPEVGAPGPAAWSPVGAATWELGHVGNGLLTLVPCCAAAAPWLAAANPAGRWAQSGP